jgi:diadenylate cyclase
MDALRNIITGVQGVFLTLGQTVGVRDVIDILIIAYLLYRILAVMKKTSSGSVIKGIVLLLLVAWLSDLLQLSIISYLLRQALEMGVIVLVVLFQPELRKLFEQVGSSRLSVIFKKRAKLESIENCIKSVVAACENMAKSKTGALIVFERDVGLGDYAASGTRIDSQISAELIQNIFFKNSPLHDGALLIRDGRLLAAACMLPLSNNATMSRELGMRHRAGVGMSERSDAVAVIISEQSGSISVATDGMLKRHLPKDTLDKLLRSELMMSENKGKDKSRKLKVKK